MNKTTLELSTGDVVIHYGVRLRLTDRREYGTDSPVVVFGTEYVGTVDPAFNPEEALGRYGKEMVRGLWKIQGNRYATWAVEA